MYVIYHILHLKNYQLKYIICRKLSFKTKVDKSRVYIMEMTDVCKDWAIISDCVWGLGFDLKTEYNKYLRGLPLKFLVRYW